MTPIFRGTMSEDGVVQFFNPLLAFKYRAHLRSLSGKPVEVIVRRVRSQRSLRANAFYFGVVVPLIAEELGYEKQECHEVLAMHFLRIEDCPITGAPRRKRTPDCDSAEFAAFVESCIRFAADHGVRVPEPHEVTA